MARNRPRAVRRLRRATLLCALPVAVAAVWVWPSRTTPQEWLAARPATASVSILSFNILRGGAPAAEALDAIAAAAADVLCLQELTPALAAAFETRLGTAYGHRLFEPRPGTQGIGIASRYPLTDRRVLTLGMKYLPAAAAAVELPAGTLDVVCVHLVPPQAGWWSGGNLWRKYQRNRSARLTQATELLRHLRASDGPAIILGDVNEWPGQAAVSLLAEAGFADACEGRGARCAPTWPGAVVPLPALFRIDQILGRGVVLFDAAVLEAGGSDHYPVVARGLLQPRRLARRVAP